MAKSRLHRALVEQVVRELGRQGGEARAKRLSPDRRHEIARKAALARWSRKGSKSR